ncbi:MAG: flagellin [Ruminococcus sp.]|nr:flagellin [Ruminococcus sp.]
MVVRTNTMAINANNALNKNNSTVAGNLEKLSTGFKINRAADDASGLAISEKMKAQIKALDTASKNAQDGASLIKTAEGYMGEVHDMLNRIVELAEKSANGTYEVKDGETAATEDFGSTGVDRQALQDEVNQLTAEIDRIAETANFNELKLFNGDMDTTQRAAIAVNNTDAAKLGGITYKAVGAANGTGSELTLQIGETSSASDKLGLSLNSLKTEVLFRDMSAMQVTTKLNADGDAAAKQVSLTADNHTSGISKNSAGITLNISNQQAASVVAEKVRDVINDVSAQRANLGALENRLDYTMNNLNTASENITDANSRIRDTDMAKTMMQYTQGNTLTQAAQAMLAQANQAPSSVLQLLQ